MAFKEILIDGLKKAPGFLWVREVYRLTSPRLLKTRKIEEEELAHIMQQIGSLLQQPLANSNKTVLIMGMGRVRYIAQESVVRKAFELAGYRCIVMIPQDRMVIKAYHALGSDKLVFLDKYQAKPVQQAAKLLAHCKTLDDLTALMFKGVRCGKYAASTLMRKTRSGTFDLSNAKIRSELTIALNHSLRCIDTAGAVLDDIKPDALVLVDRGYSPSGEFFDLCVERKIPVITWNAAHKNDTLMLKRYTASNRDVHPSSLSAETWQAVQAMSWSTKDWQLLHSELEHCYHSGQWYGEVGTQFNKKTVDKDSLKARLGINPGRKMAVIFPHIFWDATFFWGEDLFENYETWFMETVKAACANDKLDWVIKVHPANLVKDQRDGIFGEHSEITAIRKAVGALPPHVKLLPADTDISTISLFSAMDCCVTVRGTVGIEAACFGVPVLTAGTGRFDRLGFTLDSSSKQEYIEKLAGAELLPLPTEKQTELARRYAYGFLFARPVRLSAIHMRFQQTARADLEIEYRVDSLEALRHSPDLRAMADWIASGKEDYTEPSSIEGVKRESRAS